MVFAYAPLQEDARARFETKTIVRQSRKLLPASVSRIERIDAKRASKDVPLRGSKLYALPAMPPAEPGRSTR